MQAYREVTDWTFPNHTYLLDGNNLIAYIKFGESTPFYFSKPIKGFDKRGRKFVEASTNLFAQKPKSEKIAVKGSKGQTYFVDPAEKTCTCPGFTFRGNCKHLEMV